jgi:hypothetical protein
MVRSSGSTGSKILRAEATNFRQRGNTHVPKESDLRRMASSHNSLKLSLDWIAVLAALAAAALIRFNILPHVPW